jgi:hypothetical protein
MERGTGNLQGQHANGCGMRLDILDSTGSRLGPVADVIMNL